ncbi:hypothetical protein DRE_07358 [Drechslerella stenobrocha 248]|uniref:Rhodopsin domain-containing protein n=1 Tax=Drechslerella stenobrocha 248 TaxID=1043628 RepID=W7I4T2_9PEZI|nr:hypothetical protein DRE_07358 [Drechslerella stenobrocha 248]
MVEKGFSDGKLNLNRDLEDPESAYVLLTNETLEDLLKLLYFSTFPYYLSLWGVKLYLLILYYGIVVPGTFPSSRLLLHALSVLTGLTCIVWIGINMFWCLPVSENWDVGGVHRACVAYYARAPYIVTVSMHAGTEILSQYDF